MNYVLEIWEKKMQKKMSAFTGLNHGPRDLQSYALPLS